MASSPFGFGPPASLPRRSVIDPITGLPVITSAPTGEIVRRSTVLPVGYDAEGRAHLAAPAPLAAMQDALNYVGDVAAGRKRVIDPATGHVSDEAVGKGLDLAGLAMTGGFVGAAPRRISQAFADNGGFPSGAALREADPVASRVVPVYDPIPRPARPFEADYPVGRWPDGPPADASGRLTRDIEGRPLNLDAFVVGRGAVGGPDRPLPQAELDAVTAALLGDHAQGVAPSALGRRAVGKFVAGHDPATGEARYNILVDQTLSPTARDAVVRHEFGHVVDHFAPVLQTGLSKELAGLYNETNNSAFRGSMALRGNRPEAIDEVLAQGRNRRNFTPEAAGYPEARAPEELMAEAVRFYATDPNAMKAAYPKTAARIRGAVNESPTLAPHIQFNAGGRSGAPVGATILARGEDPLAALEIALAQGARDAAPLPPGPRRVDPNASSWDLYHGSTPGPDFRRFDPQANSNPAERGAVFFAPDGEMASVYANGSGEAAEAGPRVFRARVDPGKTGVFDLRDLAETDPSFNAAARSVVAGRDPRHGGALFDDYMGRFRGAADGDRAIAAQLAEMALPPGERTGISSGYGHIPAAIERARAQGLDTAVLRGLAEHDGADQVVVLTPGRVRSHYSGDLLYSGAPIAFGMGGAALATPDAAQATPSQGSPSVSASPFGLGAAMRPEDLVRLFQADPMGAAQMFRSGPQVPPPVLAPSGLPARPRPLSFGAPPDPQAADGSVRVPLPPTRPDAFRADRADMPAETARPIVAAGNAAPPAAEGPSLLDRIMGGIRQSDGLLTSLGIGLMSTPGFGQGVAAGLQSHQQGEGRRAASRLAQSEHALKARKLANEERGQNATRAYLLSKGLSAELADAAMANPSVLSSTLAQINKDPARVTIGGNIYELRSGERPGEGNRLGPAEAAQEQAKLVEVPIGNGQTQKMWLKPGETAGQAVGVPERSGAGGVAAQIEERRQALQAAGMDPKDPRNEDYILTGRRPREDQQRLTAGDKKVVNAAEDDALQLDNTISTLGRARELNRQTYTGSLANMRAQIGTRLPDWMAPDGLADPRTAEATREFGQIMSMEAIKAMSATLKGATTDREMARFEDILGDPTTPPDVRERTIDRMLVLAQRQKELARSRIEDMREGTYYKPRGGSAPQAALAPPPPARDPLAAARDAIGRGAPRDAVIRRLREAGIDPAGL